MTIEMYTKITDYKVPKYLSVIMYVAFKPVELFQFVCGLIGLGVAGGISYLIFKWIARKPDKLYRVRKLL